MMEKETILVVEDNEFNLKLVRTLLLLDEYHVLEASDAETGIQLARDYRPDLILMDIQLPGLDGLEATRMIRKDPDIKDIPVVAITAHAMKGDEKKTLDAGCIGYIPKPIDTRSFIDTVKQLKTGNTQQAIKSNRPYRQRILLVDDDPMNLKLLASMLPKDKYDIITADNGTDGLEKTFKEHPDLILLDIMMPDINGYDVTRKLKSDPETAHIPIMLVTALDGDEDKAMGLEAGADEFLNKPVNMSELRARVQSLLRLKVFQEQLHTRSQSEKFVVTPSDSRLPEEETIESPSILIVEDNPVDARLLEQYLDRDTYRIKTVSNGEDAIEYAQSERIDLILVDIVLPGIDGFELIERFKKMDGYKNVQVIVITSLEASDERIRGINLGVDDYLTKPVSREELTARANALMKKKAYMDRLSSQYESALQAAISDKMTGIYNHAYFKHFLNLEVKRSMRQKHLLALIMIDIDDFKNYNDTYGHLVGDELLKWMGWIIRQNIREVDLPARYGGEEFAVVLPYADSYGASVVAYRIQEAISTNPFTPSEALNPGKATVSMGIALYPEDASSSEELIQMADRALYRAKEEGKNRVCLFDKSVAVASEPNDLPASPQPRAFGYELNETSEIANHE